MSTKILLVGAGGHSWVVLDALLTAGEDIAGIRLLDESPARIGTRVLGLTVEKLDDGAVVAGDLFHICVGDNRGRAALFERLVHAGASPLTVLHPACIIAKSASVGEGAFVAARAVIGPGAVVGRSSIINHGAIVDHECRVGAFCHIAPNATLGGNVTLEDGVLFGAGANVLPGVKIGLGATIGAGAVVTADIETDSTYIGVPARRMR